MSEPQHICRESEDPRHANRCACGAYLDLPDGSPVVLSRPRNLDFERQAINHVAKGLADPEPLWNHMMARSSRTSYTPQDRVRVGIDWLREGKNELPDCVNYWTWWLEENLEHPDREHLERALQYVVLAYDAARRVDN